MRGHNKKEYKTPENLFSDFPNISRAEWEEKINSTFKKGDYREKLTWRTIEDLEVLPFYTREEIESLYRCSSHHQTDDAGWMTGQQINANSVESARNQIIQASENGADAVMLISKLTAGKRLQGVNLQSKADYENLFKNIDPIPTVIFDTGLSSPFSLAAFSSLENQVLPASKKISTCLLYDPLTQVLYQHGDETCLDRHLKDLSGMINTITDLPGNNFCIGLDVATYLDNGASTVQEVAIALSLANEYLAVLPEVDGLKLNHQKVLGQLFFNFGIGSSYFKEIAKFRAIRFLLRYLLKGYEMHEDEQVRIPPVFAVNSNWNKAVYDAHTNILRSTTEAMSAVAGGCDLLVTTPYDHFFRESGEHARRIARNEQLVLKEEAYFNKVADPGRGSFYIEMLTKKISEAAWEQFLAFEEQGGFRATVKSGYLHQIIQESRQKQLEQLNRGKRTMVGVNNYPNTKERMLDELIKNTQGKKLDTNRPDSVEVPFDKLIEKVSGGTQLASLLAHLLPAEVDGTDGKKRLSRHFEQLRLAAEKYQKNTGSLPTVALIPFGNAKMRAARANFAANFFGLAGYQIMENLYFDSVESTIEHLKNCRPDVTVLCSSDKEYLPFCESLAEHFDPSKFDSMFVIAGNLEDKKAVFNNLGINYFIYSGMNVYKVLKYFHQQLGITN